MSEEKPFAVIEESDGMRRLVVGGIEVDSEADYEDGWSVAQSIVRGFRADKINAAVEAREARLRGTLAVARDALRLVAECDDHGTIGCEHAECRLNDRSHRFDRETAKAALARLDDPGDYVPRAALVEAEAKVKALQAVNDLITDVLGDDRLHLQNAREVAAQAAAHLEAAGLRKPTEHKWWVDRAGKWHTDQRLRPDTAHLDLCFFDAPQCHMTRLGASRYCDFHRALMPKERD